MQRKLCWTCGSSHHLSCKRVSDASDSASSSASDRSSSTCSSGSEGPVTRRRTYVAVAAHRKTSSAAKASASAYKACHSDGWGTCVRFGTHFGVGGRRLTRLSWGRRVAFLGGSGDHGIKWLESKSGKQTLQFGRSVRRRGLCGGSSREIARRCDYSKR
ncbi:hypothetical protein AAG570_007036 [Ranatra chinensis]|uniref:Uncharacterized protein n=1 Tax=Ranatra chinensis TaxID=642074 RepID=A0ABD0YXY8_9HEMI